MAARLLSLAFHLPQFHTIPENDRWWGPGFTEWTHMDRARSWFPGHVVRQPVPPLGRYNLLDPGVVEAQHALAVAHGIDGFLVWDYWLGGGRRLLDQPVAMILRERLKVDYALAWGNHSWVDQLRGRVLAEQRYLGAEDYAAYFLHCLPHFRSERYVRVDGKPLFFVYRPEHIPDLAVFVDTWRSLAQRHGLPGLWLVGDNYRAHTPRPAGFDAYSCGFGFWTNRKKWLLNLLKENLRRRLRIQTSPQRFRHERLLRDFIPHDATDPFVPTVITGWDTTPRHGRNGVVVEGLTPEVFRDHLAQVATYVNRQHSGTRLVLVKSWNEWAEGNLLEPDSVHGDALLREYGQFATTLAMRLAAGG